MNYFINRSPEHGPFCPRQSSPVRNVRTRLTAIFTAGCWAVLALVLTGCQTVGMKPVSFITPYKPENVFLAQATLPADIKRVAVLPLVCDSKRADMLDGRDELDPILIAQVIKTKRFEVVRVLPEALRRETGQAFWCGDEVLPDDFFAGLRKVYNCDAVLFCQLTEFRPYPPLAIGWRLKLVDARSHRILWAGDEQFDAGEPGVIAGALRYQQQNQNEFDNETTGWVALNSPRDFGQYTVAQLLNTLPAR
jgi:hypothetical protein